VVNTRIDLDELLQLDIPLSIVAPLGDPKTLTRIQASIYGTHASKHSLLTSEKMAAPAGAPVPP
jgi:hypothetical protein